MKLRITDGRTRAVEFEACNEKHCRHAAIRAAAEFSAHQLLQLHVWDGEAWCGVRHSGRIAPLAITQRKLFAGTPLWEHIESSYRQARTMIDGCRDLQIWMRRSFIETVK